MEHQAQDKGPWYTEPWPWILMAGPLIAIVGCVITIVLAFGNNPDRDVRTDARKQGLMVTRSAGPPASAAQAEAPAVRTQ